MDQYFSCTCIPGDEANQEMVLIEKSKQKDSCGIIPCAWGENQEVIHADDRNDRAGIRA